MPFLLVKEEWVVEKVNLPVSVAKASRREVFPE